MLDSKMVYTCQHLKSLFQSLPSSFWVLYSDRLSSVKTVRQVMYGLGHAKSGVSPKTRTFSLMFV
jgi:hypothetical protein